MTNVMLYMRSEKISCLYRYEYIYITNKYLKIKLIEPQLRMHFRSCYTCSTCCTISGTLNVTMCMIKLYKPMHICIYTY